MQITDHPREKRVEAGPVSQGAQPPPSSSQPSTHILIISHLNREKDHSHWVFCDGLPISTACCVLAAV